MQVIGVTGNSGSGKSSVAKIIEKEYNANLLDADKIARELLEQKSGYYNEIVNTFGKGILIKNDIDRKKLSRIIYENKEELEKLNIITNKYVVLEILKRIRECNKELIVVDVPLLFENNMDNQCDIVIAIIADNDKKVKRICKRDNILESVALQRLSIQPNDNFYKERTKYIIENNKDEEQLKKEIKNVLKLGGIRKTV